MYRIKEALVVEGRYDKNTLAQIIDAPIFTTEGFGIFKDPEKLALLRAAAEKRGLILLTAARHDLLRSSRNVPVSFKGIGRPGAVSAALCFFLVVCLRSFAGSSMVFPWKGIGAWGTILTDCLMQTKRFIVLGEKDMRG